MTSLALLLLVVLFAACDGDKTGATDSSSDGGTTDSGSSYHPDGWSDPAQHGTAARQSTDSCVTCHGTSLEGSGESVSCDTCHTTGWRTDCTFCHGGTDNTTGAPPRDINDETDSTALSFSAHTVHVSDSARKLAFDCTACHSSPADVLSSGHLFIGDTTPGAAEMDFSSGLSPAASWDGLGTCSEAYCHGNGQGNNGTVTVGSDLSACTACHPHQTSGKTGWATMSGFHERHLSIDSGFDCGDCHKSVVDKWEPITDVSLHVDGAVSIQLVGEMAWDEASRTCTGECHDEKHSARSWYDAKR
jgi:hypothetical protein